MKIKAIALTMLSSIVAISALSLNQVSADDKTLVNDTEISSIISAVEERNAEVSDAEVYSVYSENLNSSENMSVYDLLSIKNYDVEKAYKLYPLENLMITEYKKNTDFKSLIREDGERIMLPADGKLVTLMEKDSAYEVIETTGTDEIFDFITLTEGIKNSIDEEIVNIINTYNSIYYMNVIYVETAENEYAVPYFRDTAQSKEYGDRLIWGTVYSVPEFMDRMDQIYDEEAMFESARDADGNAIYGGVPIKEYKPYVPSVLGVSSGEKPMVSVSEEASNNFAAVIVSIAAASAITFLVAFFILNTKNKKKI